MKNQMPGDPIVDQIYRQAFTEVLYEKAKSVLCPDCSKILESAALDRYRMKMAKRRQEISDLQVKAERERQQDARRRELEKQNRENQKGTNE